MPVLIILQRLDDCECIGAESGDCSPVFCCYCLLREEVASHSDTCHAGLEPSFEVLLSRFYTTVTIIWLHGIGALRPLTKAGPRIVKIIGIITAAPSPMM